MTTPEEHITPAEAPRPRSILRRLLRLTAWMLGILVVLLLGLVLVLQTDWGRNIVRSVAEDQLNQLLDQGRFSVGRVEGNMLTHLTAYDLDIEQNGESVIHIDSARAHYTLWPLFRNTVHLKQLNVSQPVVNALQKPDSTWNLGRLMVQDQDTTPSTWTVLIDQLELAGGRSAVRYYAPTHDSTLHLHAVHLKANAFLYAPDSFQVRIDTLHGGLQMPTEMDQLDIQLAGDWIGGQIRIDTLQAASASSMVTAGGTLAALDENAPDALRFHFEARPLAFRDIAALVPGLDPGGQVDGQVQLTGQGRNVVAQGDLNFSDGASVALDALLSPNLDGPLAYRMQADLKSLNLAYLTGDPTLTSRLNAALAVDLSGTTLQTLEGNAEIELYESTWNNRALPLNTFTSTVTQGKADFQLRAGFFGARVSAAGTARPFNEAPTYALNGRFEQVILRNFLGEEAPDGRFSGTFSLNGQGSDAAGATATAEVNLETGSYENVEIQTAYLNTQLRGGRLRMSLGGAFAQGTERRPGQIQAVGSVDLNQTDLVYRIQEGSFEHINVADFMSDPALDSDLSGTFSLEGRNTDAGTPTLNGLVHLYDARYNTYAINTADVEAHFERNVLDVLVQSHLEGGSFDLDGTLDQTGPNWTYSVRRATFEQVDLGTLLQDPTQSTNLNGRFTLTGTGHTSQNLDFTLQGLLTASQYNDQRIDAGDMVLQMRRGNATFNTEFDFPEGSVVLQGNGTPFADIPTYSVTEGTFERLNIGAILGNESLTSDFNGRFQAAGRGFDPATAVLGAQLDLIPSRFNQESISTGRITIEAASGRVRIRSEAGVGSGRIMMAAAGRPFDEVIQYEALGQMRSLNMAGLVGIDTLQTNLNLDFSFSGRGTDPRTMDLAGLVTVQPSRLDAFRIDTMMTQFNMTRGQLAVDTLFLQSNVAGLTGHGPISLTDGVGSSPSDFSFEGTIRSLAPLARLVGASNLEGEGTLKGVVTGRAGRPRFEINPDLSFLIYDDIRISEIGGRIFGEYDEQLRFETHALLGYSSFPGFSAESSRIELAYAPEGINYDITFKADGRRDGRFSGALDLADTRPPELRIDTLNLRLDQARWRLSQNATVTFESGRFNIRNFLLYTADQQIAVDGEVDLNGEQNLVLTIEEVRTGAITDLLQYPDLDGKLNGYLILSGPAASPVMEGNIELSEITYRERPVGAFRTDVNYADFRLNLDALFSHENGNRLTARGFLPADLALNERENRVVQGDVDFSIQSDSFAINWAQPFILPGVLNQIEGYMTADISITGTGDDPEFSGDMHLYDGRLGLIELNTRYRKINGEMTLSGNQGMLRAVTAESWRGNRIGHLTAQGTLDFVSLTDANLDLTARMETFRAIWTETYQAFVDGNFIIRGTIRNPIVTGDLTLGPADIFLTEELTSETLEPVELTERDLQILERRFGYRITEDDTTTYDVFIATEMDLDVTIEQDVWLRSTSSPEMDIEFNGELRMTKQAGSADPQLFGNIDVNTERSSIKQFNKRFDIEQGSIVFNGPIEEATMDLEARYEVPSRLGGDEITIVLDIEGRQDELTFNYRTDPAYDPPMRIIDIVSYITFGQPAGEGFFGGGSGGIEGQATELVIGQLSNLIAAFAGDALGLDVIEIENSGLEGATITIGKYLSRDLYASVSQPIVMGSSSQAAGLQQGTSVTLEYEVFEWMLVRLAGRNQALRFNLLWEYSF